MESLHDDNDEKPRPSKRQRVRQSAWTLSLLARFCWKDLQDKNAMTVSAALTFRTVFAIVPVMILAFLIFKSVGAVDKSKEHIRDFLDKTGVSQIVIPDDLFGDGRSDDNRPRRGDGQRRRAAATQPGAATQPAEMEHAAAIVPPPAAEAVRTAMPRAESNAAAKPETATAATEEEFRGTPLSDKIITILDNAEKKLTFARLGPISLVLVAWSAITLLTTLERALNVIFEAPRSRPLAVRVLLYWSGVTFLPLVLTAMFTLSTYATSMITISPGMASAMVLVEFFLNILLSMIALAAIYKFMPHTLVRFRHAVTAAAIVVPVWMIIKWAFSLYVMRVAGSSLYGGLGALPLFLLWLNLCWYLLLIGADIAYALSNRTTLEYWQRSGGNTLLGPTELTLAACALADAYGASEGPVTARALSQRLRIPEPAIRRLMTRLVEADLVARVIPDGKSAAHECYLPARPPQNVPLADLMKLGNHAGPDNAGQSRILLDPGMTAALDQMRKLTHDAFTNQTLADLVKERRGDARTRGE